VRIALLVLVGVVLAGCGEEAEPAAVPTEPAKSDPRARFDETELEIRQAANAYLQAFGNRDWKGVCAALVPSERRYFDRLAGDCERPFRQGWREMTKGARRLAANAIAGEIRIGPYQAVIHVTESGSPDPYMRLYAIEENGHWGIARSRKLREG
jgi:hypothetical protein